jgi:hypothetical protein
MRTPFAAAAALAATCLGCASIPPPRSMPPSADVALTHARDQMRGCVAVQAAAKIDHFSDRGRFRGDLLLFAARPARLRMDIVSPFGVALATLTSDGTRFALSDLRDKRFLVGPAAPCNIARLTSVPLPGHVLVDLLRGEAPLLRRAGTRPTITWRGDGQYVVTIPSTQLAEETVAFAVPREDIDKPWAEQRLRLTEVAVHQAGELLWRARFDGHAKAPTAGPRVDPDGLEPPTPPSGPVCPAELPRRIRVEVPDDGQDVLFRYDQVTWNPPLPEGTFDQPQPPGTKLEPVVCE